MAQIYQQRAMFDRAPSTPDTSVMSFFDEQRKASLKSVDQSMRIMVQRHAKEVQGLKDLSSKRALQVYKNAYEIFQDDPQGYKNAVKKGLNDIYEAIPDKDMRQRVADEVSIAGSGYDAKVIRNYNQKQESIANMYIRDAVFAQVGSAKENASLFYESINPNNADEEKAAYKKAYEGVQAVMLDASRKVGAVDSKGNPLFSASEREQLRDSARNFHKYAVLDYISDNVQSNPNGAEFIYNYMKNNKDEIKQTYNLTDEAYSETIKESRQILANEATSQEIFDRAQTRASIAGVYQEMEIKGGKINNRKYNNLTATIELHQSILDAEANGDYIGFEGDAEKKKGELANVIVNQVEGGRKIKKRAWFGDNAGEVAINKVNENITDIMPFIKALGVDETRLKAGMYARAIGGISRQQNISMTDKSKESTEVARGLANAAMYEELDRYVGGMVQVDQEKARNNPAYVKNQYIFALAQLQNQQAKDYFAKLLEQ